MRTVDLSVHPLAELCANVLKRAWPENNIPCQDIYCDSETVGMPTDEPGSQNFQTNQEAVRFWETDEYGVQAVDVQGWLRKSLRYALHAPPPVLDCIAHGYHLPLKFLPPQVYSHISSRMKDLMIFKPGALLQSMSSIGVTLVTKCNASYSQRRLR